LERMVPQVAQGALAVECRADDVAVGAMARVIEHPESRRRVDAERAFLAELGGDCDLPAGAHAVVGGDPVTGPLTLTGVLAGSGEPGARLVRNTVVGSDPVAVGTSLARLLREELAEP